MIFLVIGVGCVVVCLTIVICYFWVHYFKDIYDSDLISNIITIVTLSLVTSLLIIIPTDIYAASNTKVENKKSGDISTLLTSIAFMFFELLSLLTVTCVIPYAYFRYEEEDGDKKMPLVKRILRVVRFGVISGVVIIVVYLVGVFIPFTSKYDSSMDSGIEAWQEEIMPSNWLERGYQFLHACISVFGYIFLLTYTAYGMADAGMSLLKNKKDDVETESLVVEQLEKIRDEMQTIRDENGEGRIKDKKARLRMAKLRVREKKLVKAQEKIKGGDSWISKVLIKLRPFGIVFGLIFILFAVFLIISMLITLVVSIVKSSCGFKCGFVLDDPKSLNPLDLALRMLNPFFPLDYIVFGVVILFEIFSTLNGVAKISIRIFCIELFEVKPKSTWPQGLLLTAVIVTFSTYSFVNMLYFLAPIYFTFGNQQYVTPDGSKEQCSLQSPVESCTLSRSGRITLVNFFGYNFFAVLNYFVGWVFCIAWGVSIGLSFFLKKKKKPVEVDEELLDN